MDLKWVKTFITVYEEGSFRAAAEKLFISQPSITVHVKALEEALHVRLFEREHTKVTLTEAGKQYYTLGKQLLAQVEHDKRLMQTFNEQTQIKLTIALSPSLTSSPILQLIQPFLVEHPQFAIEVIMQDTPYIDELLIKEDAHLVISLQRTKQKILHAEKLWNEPVQLIYSAHIPLAIQPPYQQLASLLNTLPLYIGYLPEHAPLIEALAREYEVKPVHHVQDSIFAIRLIKEQLGIGLLPPFQIAAELAEGSLHMLPIGPIATLYTPTLYVNYRRHDERIQPFLAYLRKAFQ